MAARRLSKQMYTNQQITKNPKITKYELCNLYVLQNENLKCLKFFVFYLYVPIFESILAFLVYFVQLNRYFEYRIRILCIFLYMQP